MPCSYCGSTQHTIGLCPKTAGGSSARAHLHCGYCGSKDHNEPACLKTQGGNAARAWQPDSVADHFILDRQNGH